MNSLTKYEAERQQRSIDLNQATLELIQGSCFPVARRTQTRYVPAAGESILGEHPSEDLIVAPRSSGLSSTATVRQSSAPTVVA